MTPVTRHALGAAALLCAALLAVACSSSTSTSGTSLGSTSPSAPAPSSAPATPATSSAPASPAGSAGVTGCASRALKVKVNTAQSGAAAGSTYVPIDFTNIGSSTCTLFGYPGVSAVESPSGSQLGRAATRDPAAVAALVTLVPGGVAHAVIQVANAQNYSASQCSPVTAHYLRIYPPNQFTAIYARYTVLVCSAKLPHAVGSQLRVFVVRPGPGKTGQAP